MLHISILVLQSIQYTTAVTLPHVTYYWRTTGETDIPDYFNHGPIFIPGMQEYFTLFTKQHDIFPPWLTRSTTVVKISSDTQDHDIFPAWLTKSTTLVKISSDTTAKEHHTIPIILPKSTTTSQVTAKTVSASVHSNELTPPMIDKNKTDSILDKIKKRWDWKFKPSTQHSQKTTTVSTDFEEDEETVPFSVFLRKLFKSLAAKSLPELPALLEPFVAYIEELLENNELRWLGNATANVQKIVKYIRTLSRTTPDILHTKCYQIFTMLSDRLTLGEDVNRLLTTLDDMYTEAEEEDMQKVLHDVIGFPNRDKTTQDIAHEFVNNLILLPMKRVLGTSKGDDMLLMLKNIIENKDLRRKSNLRINNKASTEDEDETSNEDDVNNSTYTFKPHETHKKNMTVNPSKRYPEELYQKARKNIGKAQNLMKNFESSSTETIDYELSPSLASEEKVDLTKEDVNVFNFQNYKGSHDELYKNSKEKLRTKKYKVKSGNFDSVIDKYDVIRRAPNENYGSGNIELYKNTKSTILIPKWPLLTKIIKDVVVKYENPKNTLQRKLPTSGNTYFKSHRENKLTKSVKELSYKIISKKPLTNTYPSRLPLQIIHQSTKKTKSKRKSSVKDKSKAQAVIKYQNANKGTTNHFLYDKIDTSRMQNEYMKVMKELKDSVTGSEYENIENLKSKELGDTTSNTELFSEDTGDGHRANDASRDEKVTPSVLRHGRAKNKKHRKHRHRNRHKKRRHKHGHRHSHYNKRKYEELKHKYRKLKQRLARSGISDDSNVLENNKKHGNRMKPVSIKFNYRQTFPALFGNLGVSRVSKRHKQYTENNTFLLTAVTQRPEVNLDLLQLQRPKILRLQTPEINNIRNFVSTTKVVKQDPTVKEINVFLDDYDNYDSKGEIPQFQTPFKNSNNTPYYTKPTKAYQANIIRKSFPQNATTGKGFELFEDSDAAKELKNNIYDAFRHMDFNVSRSYHNDTMSTSKAHLQDSVETDVEAVLKSNIYKAVKKLLKK